MVASILHPFEASSERSLHFALNSISLVPSNSLFPLQLRIHVKIPVLWRRRGTDPALIITLFDLYILKTVVVVAVIIQILRGIIIWSTVTPQIMHVAWLWLHHWWTFSAWFGSWKFLHLYGQNWIKKLNTHTPTHWKQRREGKGLLGFAFGCEFCWVWNRKCSFQLFSSFSLFFNGGAVYGFIYGVFKGAVFFYLLMMMMIWYSHLSRNK